MTAELRCSRFRGTISSVLVFSLLLAAAPALAQAPDATKEDAAKARQLFDEGVALFAEDRYPAALVKFEASYALKPAAGVLYNIAGCRKATGDYVGAIAAFEEYLEKRKDKVTADERTDIGAQISGMQRDIGVIEIRGKERGVQVLVDGNDRGKTPLSAPLPVNPGRHAVMAVGDGRPPARKDLLVDAGGTATVDLDALLPAPVPVAKPPAPAQAAAKPAPAEPAGPPAAAPPPQTHDGELIVEALEESGTRPAKVAFAVFLTTGLVTGFSSIFVGLEASDRYELWQEDTTLSLNKERSQQWNAAANSLYTIAGTMGFCALVSGITWGVQARRNKGTGDDEDGKEDPDEVAARLLPAPGGAALILDF
ncbi:MAG TPA: hypothetical protein VM285_15820 [Polyangia bacterium]|nr:hypothetical protein [Polyangia bacterium]